MARIIGYQRGMESQIIFDEIEMDKLLKKAKEEGTIVDYDTGRGNCLWFNGRPGKALRKLRKTVDALIVINKA